jgi:hypothetical protein
MKRRPRVAFIGANKSAVPRRSVLSTRAGVPEKQNARWSQPPGILFWRRPIDSFAPAHSPATLAGLTVYPPAAGLAYSLLE